MTYLQVIAQAMANDHDGKLEVGTDINIAALDVQNRVGIATPTYRRI